jgi:uncharacterized membrane protein
VNNTVGATDTVPVIIERHSVSSFCFLSLHLEHHRHISPLFVLESVQNGTAFIGIGIGIGTRIGVGIGTIEPSHLLFPPPTMTSTTTKVRSSVEVEVGTTMDEESTVTLLADEEEPTKPPSSGDVPIVSSFGLKILCLLAVQNCFKSLLMRYVMKDKPDFLTSTAVIGVEVVKLVLSVCYILIIDKRPLSSIYTFMRDDSKHAILLTIPAAAYSFQMSMEYVALANLNAAIFSVLVQTKLLTTASFSALILRTKFKYIQIISLVLLTVGVMLININSMKGGVEDDSNNTKGVMATLGECVLDRLWKKSWVSSTSCLTFFPFL